MSTRLTVMDNDSGTQFINLEARAEPFAYVCNRCLKCCKGKRIQVNPYEVARLARNQGVSTSEFRDKYTIDGEGTVLDQTLDSSCVFLNEQGCSVHPDRPLVCRLYPLGRQTWMPNEEAFVHVDPHPETHGVYSKNGVIDDFLKAQETDDFLKAADEYFEWYCQATEVMSKIDSEAGYALDIASLLDFDTSIGSHCAQLGIPEPIDIEDRKSMHLEILKQALSAVESSKTDEG